MAAGRGVTAPPEEPLRDEFCAPSKGQTPNNEVPNQGAGVPKAGQTPAGGGIARQHCTGRAGDPHGRAQPGGGYRPPARPAFEGRPAVPPFPSRLGPRGSGLPSRPPLSGRLQGGPAAPRCRRRPRPARPGVRRSRAGPAAAAGTAAARAGAMEEFHPHNDEVGAAAAAPPTGRGLWAVTRAGCGALR